LGDSIRFLPVSCVTGLEPVYLRVHGATNTLGFSVRLQT